MELTNPLRDCLLDARERGFAGPGEIERHFRHTVGFRDLVVAALNERTRGTRIADLGSGGGVPGLVLAVLLPDAHFFLVESSSRRAAWLGAAARDLEADNVEVVLSRAEDFAHGDKRGTFDAVTARSFSLPAVTAECGAPLLRVGGVLIVSEPPQPVESRWPDQGLSRLGLGAASVIRSNGFSFATIVLEREVSSLYPRRVGVPAKRPLF